MARRFNKAPSEDAIARTAQRMLCFKRERRGKPHATVNYVFDYSPYKLFQYHQLSNGGNEAKRIQAG